MATKLMLADNKPITDQMIQFHLDNHGFLLGQPKVDGMRVHASDEIIPTSRSGKPWKQKALISWCQAHPSAAGFDGEVVPGHVYHEDAFREGMSETRSADGSKVMTYWLFDHVSYAAYSYWDRYRFLEDKIAELGEFQESDSYHMRLALVETVRLESVAQVREYEEKCLAHKWEGAMLRVNDLPYKHGRSTNRQGYLIKLKRYVDAEAVVTGYEPWYQNENEPTLSPLGYTVRSAHQEGKVALERLGAWHVELATDRSVKFKIGVMQGVTHLDRDRLWQNRDAYIGRTCKFKHQGIGGGYDVPRQPVFLNWRDSTEF
jgi:DNA ligase-1